MVDDYSTNVGFLGLVQISNSGVIWVRVLTTPLLTHVPAKALWNAVRDRPSPSLAQ